MITLKTLPEASAQEVFDQVVKHLRTQGQKSQKFENGALKECQYRSVSVTGRTLSCAAGCLISDEEYSEEFEGKVWEWLVRDFSIPSEHKDLIRKFQKIHDKAEVKEWETQFFKLALMYNLVFEGVA